MFSTPKKYGIGKDRNIISYDSRLLKNRHLTKKKLRRKIIIKEKKNEQKLPSKKLVHIPKRKRVPIMRGAYVSKRGKKSRPDIQYLTVHTSNTNNVHIFRDDQNRSKSGISNNGQKINRIFKPIPVLSVVSSESDDSSDDTAPMVHSSRFSIKSNSIRKTPIIRRKHCTNKTVIERFSKKKSSQMKTKADNKPQKYQSIIRIKHAKSVASQKSMISINSEIDMRTIFTDMNLDCDPALEIAFGKFFNLLDIEEQGMITVKKFLETLTALNIDLSEIEMRAIRNEFSRDSGNIYLCTLVQYLMGDKQSMNISKKLKKYTMVHQNIRYQILDRLGLKVNEFGCKTRDSEDEPELKEDERNEELSPTSTAATLIFHEFPSNNSSFIPTISQEIIHGFANIAIGKVNEYLCNYKIKIERIDMLCTQHQRLIYCFTQMFGILDEGKKGYLYDREILALINIPSLDGKYLLNDRNIVNGADIIQGLRHFCCGNGKEFSEDVFSRWLMAYVLESLQFSESTNTRKLLQTISGIDSCVRVKGGQYYQQLHALNEHGSVRCYFSSESCTTPPSSVYNKHKRRIGKYK